MIRTHKIILLFAILVPLASCQTTMEEAFNKNIDPVLYGTKNLIVGDDVKQESDVSQPVLYPGSVPSGDIYAPSTMLGISRAMTDGSVDVYDLGYDVPPEAYLIKPADTMYGTDETLEDHSIPQESSVTVYTLEARPLSHPVSGVSPLEGYAPGLIPPVSAQDGFNSPFDAQGRLIDMPPVEQVPPVPLLTAP